MKTAVIVHGWDGGPNEPMLQWIKAELEKRGYEVSAPEMPDTANPVIEAWVGKLKEVIKEPNEEILLVGHSIGCQALLRYIETLPAETRVGELILIAPWMELDMNTIKEEGEEVIEIARPWMETPIDFPKIKSIVSKTVAIFSDNDPYVPLSQKDLFEKELGAQIIIEHDKVHFNPGAGISELPSILNFV